MRKKVLVIDGGGRGSALVDKYAQSKHVGKVFAIPGNDLMGINTSKVVKTYSKFKTTSTREILEICKKEKIDLVDVSQDDAIEAGLVNELIKEGIPTIGPTREAGQIEWDKVWAREFGNRHGLPQPFYKVFKSKRKAIEFLKTQPDQPWFIKAAYLAGGKGALSAMNNKEAIKRVLELKQFGDASKMFLIEKWLKGEDGYSEEFSTFVLSDGKRYKIIGSAQDHKRLNNFDEGENTGGMGCSAPPLVLTREMTANIKEKIIGKTIKGLQEEERHYKGILYFGGMMIKEKGQLVSYVIEFNARWGDPEAQVLLPGLTNDLFEVSMAVVGGDIRNLRLRTDKNARVGVAGVSRGYPGDYEKVKGKQLFGLDEARKINGVKIYGAGIKRIDGKYYASGGRLFYIVGRGENVLEARKKAYGAMSLISVEGNNLQFRTDIGYRDVERLRNM